MKPRVIAVGLMLFPAVALATMFGQATANAVLVLVFGWISYLVRIVPRITVSRPGLVTSIVCGGFFVLGLHGFLQWLYRGITGAERRWKPRWTLSFVGVVVLMFASGTAAVGITHQVGWLRRSPNHLTVSRADIGGGRFRTDGTLNSNLIQIGLAFYNYNAVYDVLPGKVPSSGMSRVSWQAAILPYSVYAGSGLELSRRADDPRNVAAYHEVVPIFLNPDVPAIRDSQGRVLSHFAGNVHILGRGRSLRFNDFEDRSQTMLVGEIATGFKYWGDPTSLRDPGRPFDGSAEAFGSPMGGGANVLMMDGSVKFISDRADPKVLRALSGLR